VVDAGGAGVPGISVTFVVSTGGGTLTGASTSTSAAGVATVGSWTLGTVAGANTVTATAAGIPSVVFAATAAAGPATNLLVTPSAPVLAPGATQQLAVSVSDQYGNVLAAAPVTYATGNAAVATVSNSGLVTAVARGNTGITVSSGAVNKAVSLTVAGRPSGASRTDVPESGQPFGVGVSINDVLLVGEPFNNRVGRFDLPSLTLGTTTVVGADPDDIAFSPDGKTAYVTNVVSATLSVIDVATNTQTRAIAMPGPAYRVAMSGDGAKLYVTTADGYLATVNVQTSVVTSLAIGGALNGIALHPTQALLYVSSTSGAVTEVSRTTGLVTRTFAVPGTAQELAISADGSQLFVANESGALEVRSTSSLALQSTVPAASNAFGLAVSPDNTQIYVSQPAAGTVLVLDRASLTVVKTFTGGSPRRIAFDRNGATAIIANEAGYVTFIR
jgi:YVTN family beta-propeller protein